MREERRLESTLYRSAVEKGRTEGRAQVYVDTIAFVLARYSITLDPSLQDRIRSSIPVETLKGWCTEAIRLDDPTGARRLAETIRAAAKA